MRELDASCAAVGSGCQLRAPVPLSVTSSYPRGAFPCRNGIMPGLTLRHVCVVCERHCLPLLASMCAQSPHASPNHPHNEIRPRLLWAEGRASPQPYRSQLAPHTHCSGAPQLPGCLSPLRHRALAPCRCLSRRVGRLHAPAHESCPLHTWCLQCSILRAWGAATACSLP